MEVYFCGMGTVEKFDNIQHRENGCTDVLKSVKDGKECACVDSDAS